MTSNLTPERATERAFERAWVIWPLFAYRRRGRRIDPGPAIPSADQAAGFLPLAKVRWRPHGGGGSHGRGPGGHHGCYCNVTFSPAGFRNGRTAWRRASRPDSGRPARRRSTAFRDGWTASRRRASRNRCASERGLAMGGGRPAERRFSKSVARSHRTVLAYWKFESISLQRRV